MDLKETRRVSRKVERGSPPIKLDPKCPKELLRAERLHGINKRRAPGGYISRHQCHEAQNCTDAQIRGRVRNFDLEQEPD